MLTVESVKCRACGARHAADAAVCPTCGTQVSQPAAEGTTPAAKPKSRSKPKAQPYKLDSEALLAKIDALDWEDPTIQPQAAPAPTAAESAPTKRSLLLPFLVGFVVLLIGVIGLRYYSDNRSAPAPAVAAAQAPTTRVATAPAPAPTVSPVPEQPAASSPSASGLTAAEAAEKAKLEEERHHRADMRRKALAAKQALEEQSRLERAEQEKLRAEQAAAEARAKAAVAAVPPAPQGPTSPQEVCAAEQNAFSLAACEARTCAQARWRNHPFCVKRWQDELRKMSPSAGGS